MTIHKAYLLAREQYAAYGIDTTRALKQLAAIRLSLHCWQGDDVAGFEPRRGNLGGVLPTGNYPGRARTPEELRTDWQRELVGKRSISRAITLMRARPAGRDGGATAHFADWVVGRAPGWDGSFFSSAGRSGRTLSSGSAIRRFDPRVPPDARLWDAN